MKQFTPADPDFAERVRGSLGRQGFMRTIGAEITAIEAGFCEISVPFQEGLSQQHGYFHGGLIATLADNAGGCAAYTLMPAESSILSVEFKVSLLAPGDGEMLIGRSWVTKAGRTLTVSHSKVFVAKAGVETQCAEGLVTLISLTGQSDHAAGEE